MRTQMFRGVLAMAVTLAVSAPAFAQSIVKGTVMDAMGQPVDGASVLIESTDSARKAETKTNKKGEFLQVGLTSGNYNVTASKGNLKQTLPLAVKQGDNRPLAFQLTPGSGLSEADRKAQAAAQAAAQGAVEALRAGRDDEAIAKFKEVIAAIPTCADCYNNLGLAYSHKQQWGEAEAAFKKVIELKPDNADAYNGLATVYNAQKKFDDAVAASQKASQLGGSAGAGGGGGAEASYNQGVILFNAGKYADAKTQFDAATKADPQHSNAFYQLGMTSLNLGQIPEAVNALQTFLKLAPSDPKAAQVQASLPALQQMLPK